MHLNFETSAVNNAHKKNHQSSISNPAPTPASPFSSSSKAKKLAHALLIVEEISGGGWFTKAAVAAAAVGKGSSKGNVQICH